MRGVYLYTPPAAKSSLKTPSVYILICCWLCCLFLNKTYGTSNVLLNSYYYTADTDYSDTPVPDVLVLDINNPRRCIYINITDDNIVEGLEIFEVHFNETDNNQINIAGTNTVQVEIEDDEGMYIHNQVEYKL